jgi:hypothetical protein
MADKHKNKSERMCEKVDVAFTKLPNGVHEYKAEN